MKRRFTFLGIDFEQYAGPLFFVYDTALLGVFVALTYALLFATAPPHHPVAYIAVGVLFFLFQQVGRTAFRVFECYMISDVMQSPTGSHRISLRRVFAFSVFAFTGVRLKKGLTGLLEGLMSWRLSFFNFLSSAFFALSLYFLVELVYLHPHDAWMVTRTTYPSSVTKVPCAIYHIADAFLEPFFDITNNAVVVDLLIALEGLYFQIMNHRFRVRTYYQLVRPKIEEFCSGGLQQIRFDESVIAMCATLVVAYTTTLIPLSLYRDSYLLITNSWLWQLTLLAVGACFVALFFLNDAGIMFFALVIPDSSFTRDIKSLGYQGFGVLIAMAVCCVFLANNKAPPSASPTSRSEPEQKYAISYLFAETKLVVQRLVHMLLSEAMLLSVVTFVLALAVGGVGVPLHKVSFQKVNGTEPWPSYMHLNAWETVFTDFESDDIVGYMYENIITNVTKENAEFIKGLCTYVSDQAATYIPNQIASYLVPGFPGISASDVTGVLCGGIDPLKDVYIDIQRHSVHYLLEGFQFVANLVASNAYDVLNQQLRAIIRMLNVDMGIRDFLDQLAQVLHAIPRIVPYIPAIFTGAMMLLSVLDPLSSVFGVMRLAVIMLLAQVVLYASAFVLSVRLLVQQFNYDIVLEVDYAILALDVLVSVLMVGCCFMLVADSNNALGVDPVNTSLIRDFDAVYGQVGADTQELKPLTRHHKKHVLT